MSQSDVEFLVAYLRKSATLCRTSAGLAFTEEGRAKLVGGAEVLEAMADGMADAIAARALLTGEQGEA